MCVDQEFSRIDAQHDFSTQARLAALLPADDVEDGELLSNNDSSTILRFSSLAGGGMLETCRFRARADAEVTIWDKLQGCHAWQPDRLSCEILSCRHLCSWLSLSHDNRSELRSEGVRLE